MHASTAILWLALVIPATAVALALIVWQTARLRREASSLARLRVEQNDALALEKTLRQLRDKVAGVTDLKDLPGEDFWLAEMRQTGIDVAGMSLQFPSDTPGHFETFCLRDFSYYDFGPFALDDYPWVRQVWDTHRPLLVQRRRLEELGFGDWQMQALLEVPLPGEGSLALNSLNEFAFTDDKIIIVGTFVGLIALAMQRMRLDEQLQKLTYLEKLRATLQDASTEEEFLRGAGQAVAEVLSTLPPHGVRLTWDGRTCEVGTIEEDGQHQDERPLICGGHTRGQLRVYCGQALTDVQERAILDESAAHIARALEANELNAQLMQSARLASLGEMATGVAHEINNPLAGLRRCLQRIGRDPANTDQIREYTGLMMDAVNHIGSITRGMLRFGRQDLKTQSSLQIGQVLREVIELSEHRLQQNSVQLELDFDPSLPPVNGDAQRLQQVFLNIVLNALDAMPDGGRLYITGRRDDGHLVVAIGDTGSGIPESELSRVFDPFFTTKEVGEGTGLGLSIAHGIVQEHGGRIELRSHQGEGSVFEIHLPLPEADLPEANLPDESAAP